MPAWLVWREIWPKSDCITEQRNGPKRAKKNSRASRLARQAELMNQATLCSRLALEMRVQFNLSNVYICTALLQSWNVTAVS